MPLVIDGSLPGQLAPLHRFLLVVVMHHPSGAQIQVRRKPVQHLRFDDAL